ncbi:MAG: hypothetical protein VX777_01640 [Chlamydiota bacterium]|nr:hypothetical protein [Chlamydiota bacterium]
MSVSNSEITRTPGSSTLLQSKISGPSEIASIFAKQLQRDSERSYFYELPKNLINDRKLIKATKSFIPELIKQHQHCDTITLKVSVIYSSIIKYALDTGFQFESANVDSAILKYQYRHSHIFSELFEQTRQHIQCLKDKGLGERSKAIQVKYFVEPLEKKELYDLTPFEKRTKIPQVVLDFDPSEKNTVITTDPNSEGNKVEDLTSILDIRLYPALRRMLHENNVEVFLGTKEEMAC